MKLKSILYRPLLAVVVFFAVLFLQVFASSGTGIANAYYLGGHWSHVNGQSLYIYYNVGGAYASLERYAAASWTQTPTKVYVYDANGNGSVNFYDTGIAPPAVGIAGYSDIHPCSGNGCIYTSADIYMYTQTHSSYSDFIKQKTACHELGHVLGLAHPPASDTSTATIMRQGVLSYNTPQQYDSDQINGLYP